MDYARLIGEARRQSAGKEFVMTVEEKLNKIIELAEEAKKLLPISAGTNQNIIIEEVKKQIDIIIAS